ncbi:MAG TPA: four helix bundle protein [Pyrinomonadaceae bacterium]|nr:four helix bundle protein [Pyrinomonadaceae bacterium]
MRPHEKLDVWKKFMDLVLEVYKHTEHFPKEERYGLTSQIRRSAVSVPANIAEGAARDSAREFAHFLSNAQGSASELETEIQIAYRLGYLDETVYSDIREALDNAGRMLIGLSRKVRGK